ncbi:MAG TPA: methyl-accepting chemotaxis protein, partial [Ruminiclostridium sp.]|nr:methyl-accepting chemotaxis protein [Ruminiclostridium sp.]
MKKTDERSSSTNLYGIGAIISIVLCIIGGIISGKAVFAVYTFFACLVTCITFIILSGVQYSKTIKR